MECNKRLQGERDEYKRMFDHVEGVKIPRERFGKIAWCSTDKSGWACGKSAGRVTEAARRCTMGGRKGGMVHFLNLFLPSCAT